jgi:hypothetical protein
MKTNVLLTTLCLAACLCGCNEANDPPDSPTWIVSEPEPPEETGCRFKLPPSVPYPLDSTQWQLVGSLDVATGELTTFRHPEECTDCYSLTFDTDSTATLRNSFQDYRIDLFHLDTCKTFFMTGILIVNEDLEARDTRLVNSIMGIVGSYAASPDALLLYYYQSTLRYLLFTRQKS